MGQDGVGFQPAGILRYVEELKRGADTESEPRDFFDHIQETTEVLKSQDGDTGKIFLF